MQIRTVFFICSLLLSHVALAELPRAGVLMDSVKAEFGTPIRTSSTVGEPPITRWYYESFTVTFEYEHVIHAFPRNASVENLSLSNISNTADLVIPEKGTTTESSPKQASPEDEPTSLGNSFFENTPDLIR